MAARDEKSGRAGSSNSWIEIPDLSSGQLALSSVLIGGRAQSSSTDPVTNTAKPIDPVQLSVAHNFSARDYLRFLVYVYNAARAQADGKPDVAIQVQVVRDNQPVVTTPLRKLSLEGIEDLSQLPYAAEISLEGLAAGRYLLQLTVVDRVSKSSASQQTRFEIE